MPHRETTLAILAGSSETERVLLVLTDGNSSSVVEMRQQSWGEGVGWFTQSHVQLEPQQVAELKRTLGQSSGSVNCRPTRPRDSVRPRDAGGFVPRVIHAESA